MPGDSGIIGEKLKGMGTTMMRKLFWFYFYFSRALPVAT